MIFERNRLKKYLTWAIITSHISLPALAAEYNDSVSEKEGDIAGTVSAVAPHVQQGTVAEYAIGKINAIPERMANDAAMESMKKWFPDIGVRGAVSLDDGIRYRSAEFDMFIPLLETTSSLLFGQLGFRDHGSRSFDGRTFVNGGLGYRHDAGDWLLGVNAFLDSDIKNSHLRGGLGAEIFKDSLSFSGNYYFPLTGWMSSGVYELHDERPAYGFDLRAKGAFPGLPWFSTELTFEQYYGDKVDILGARTLSQNPKAVGAAVLWKPVPLLEVRAGYRDAGSSGSQAEAGIKLNYVFGTPLQDQLDYRNVNAVTNSRNIRGFVDRNYNIVMEYREQASHIQIVTQPVSGLSGELTQLVASINSRYPVQKIEWSGDAELMIGLQQQGNINSSLRLPLLSLEAIEEREYSLYLTVTDSKGSQVRSERIPVTVGQDYSSFKSWINVIGEDVIIADEAFIINTPLAAGEEGHIVEWHYLRERSKEEWMSLRPRNVEYSTDTPGLALKSLGGVEKDGHWVERVRVNYSGKGRELLTFTVSAAGPDGKHPVKGKVQLKAMQENFTQNIASVKIIYTPGTDEHNGSELAPVVGTVMRAKTLCTDNLDCTDKYIYQWEVSADKKHWSTVPQITGPVWNMPYELNGETLQGRYSRVRIIAEAQDVR